MNSEIPRRKLGSTGEEVSLVGLGGAHIARQGSRSEAIRLVRAAIDSGIDFMDNCWDYHQGQSEIWMGDALRDGYRDRAFLMTKIDARSSGPARQQIDHSLLRLQTDHIDLMQLHEVIRPDDPDRAFAPGGVIEALEEARSEGKIRFVGFTGHKHPDIHLRMIDQDFTWDTVQIPVNVLDAHFNSFQKKVLPVLKERGIGSLAMKPLAGGNIFDIGVVTAVEALHYVMNTGVDVVINGCESMGDLAQLLQAARSYVPLSRDEVESLLKSVESHASRGQYEGYKISHKYDGTYHNPHWLVEARI